ncbi:hypothetical protein MOKP58_43780 [Mycobacterium avium subsp. hominissuis]
MARSASARSRVAWSIQPGSWWQNLRITATCSGPNDPARCAAAVAASTGAIGSPVSPTRGPRSAAVCTRRAASARLISVASAIACESRPPNSAGVASRASALMSGCSIAGSRRRSLSQRFSNANFSRVANAA